MIPLGEFVQVFFEFCYFLCEFLEIRFFIYAIAEAACRILYLNQ